MIATEPVWVAGKGLVAPKGWISPEARARMQLAQRECEEAAAAMAKAAAGEQCPSLSDSSNGDPAGFVVDPFGGQR